MQVGPLAQVLIGYAQGHKLTQKWAGEAINQVSAISKKQVSPAQVVVPTPWNAGPRDEHGTHRPYEASLLGNPIADAEKPLEVLRPVHSFDPCLACAIHTFDPDGKEVISVSEER